LGFHLEDKLVDSISMGLGLHLEDKLVELDQG
jgi:hypothetical protein